MDSADQNAPARTPNEDPMTDAIRQLTSRSHMFTALKLIIDSHTLVSITDRAGRIIYANDRFCEVSKYAREELIGQTHRILRSDHYSASFFEELWSTISSGGTWTGDIQNTAKDGSNYWVQSTISPICDEKNQIVGYGSIHTDVTAQRQLMVELQDNEKQAYATLKSAIDVLDNGLTIFDKDGNVVISSKKRLEMYPEAEDILTRSNSIFESLARIYPDDTPEEIQIRGQ